MSLPTITVGRDMWLECPKCQAKSGDDYAQCKGVCPMPGSPHHTKETEDFYHLPPAVRTFLERLDALRAAREAMTEEEWAIAVVARADREGLAPSVVVGEVAYLRAEVARLRALLEPDGEEVTERLRNESPVPCSGKCWCQWLKKI